jgi:hypothetical protein
MWNYYGKPCIMQSNKYCWATLSLDTFINASSLGKTDYL